MTLGTSNISVTLIKNTLGETSNSIGTLCKSNKINKWSKHKPVKFAHDTTDGYATWWRATDGNCGLKIPTITDLSTLDSGTITWDYDPPQGTSTSPFRLGDFRKYSTTGAAPLSTGVSKDLKLNIVTDNTFSIQLDISSNTADDYTLNLNDFADSSIISNCYFTAQFVSDTHSFAQSANTANALTTNVKVMDDGAWIFLPASTFKVGTYKVRFFLATVPSNIEDPKGTWYALPSDVNNKTGGINLHVTSSAAYTVSFDQISYVLNGVYRDIEDIGEMPNSGVPWTSMSTTEGDIFLKCTFTNKLETSYSLGASQIVGATSRTFVYGSTVSGVKSKLYDANKTEVDHVDVPGKSSKVYYIRLPYILALGSDGLVKPITTGTTIYVLITISQQPISGSSSEMGYFQGNFIAGPNGFITTNP